MMLCMKLPEERCLSEPIDNMMNMCGEDEFPCGDGKCIHGLSVCDKTYDCRTGADEMWYAMIIFLNKSYSLSYDDIVFLYKNYLEGLQ